MSEKVGSRFLFCYVGFCCQMWRLQSGPLQSSLVLLLRTPVMFLDLSMSRSYEWRKYLRKEFFSLLGTLGKEGFNRKTLSWFPHTDCDLSVLLSSCDLVSGDFIHSLEILFHSFSLNKRCSSVAFSPSFFLLCPRIGGTGPLVYDRMLNQTLDLQSLDRLLSPPHSDQ